MLFSHLSKHLQGKWGWSDWQLSVKILQSQALCNRRVKGAPARMSLPGSPLTRRRSWKTCRASGFTSLILSLLTCKMRPSPPCHATWLRHRHKSEGCAYKQEGVVARLVHYQVYLAQISKRVKLSAHLQIRAGADGRAGGSRYILAADISAGVASFLKISWINSNLDFKIYLV